MVQQIIVIAMHPRLRRLWRNESEAEGTHTPLPGLPNGLNVGTCNSKWRVRFLIRLWDYVAGREIEELTVIFPVSGGKHGNDSLERFQSRFPLRAHLRSKRVQLRLITTFGNAVRLVRRDLNDTVAKTDILSPLARCT
jgi:hypothetical protein